MPALGVQVTQGGEAVKPGISNTFDEAGAVRVRQIPQRINLWGKSGEVVWRLGRKNMIELPRDGLHQLVPNSGGEGLEGSSVHAVGCSWARDASYSERSFPASSFPKYASIRSRKCLSDVIVS